MLYAGLVAGIAAGNAAAHSAGLNAFRVYVATLVLIVPAIMGGRLFYTVTHLELYRGDFRQIWDRGNGGAAMYGGLPSTLLVSIPLLAVLRLPFGGFWDVATFTILVGMIFARAGCLLNGCCAGRPTRKWMGMHAPNPAGVWEKRMPTQLLEAGWTAVLLGAAIAVRSRLPFSGALFLFVAAGYGAGRLVLEGTRERHSPAGGFTLNHGISLALVVVSLAVLAGRWPN